MSRLRTCGSKRRHTDRESADEHRRALVRQGAVRLRVYRCRFCDSFHVGHTEHMGRRRR